MRSSIVGWMTVWVWWMAGSLGWAAATEARLVLSAEQARPGATVMAGVRLAMQPGWHIYWRNGGDSGAPTEIKWRLPQGIVAGPIQWPVPKKYVEMGLITYTYEGETMLTVPLTVASNCPPGSHRIAATVDWLECDKSCVPGSGEVEAQLTVGGTDQPSADAPLIASWQGTMPLATVPFELKAVWEPGASAEARFLALRWPESAAGTNTDFYPFSDASVEISQQTSPLAPAGGLVGLRKAVKRSGAEWPGKVAGLFVVGAGAADARGYNVDLVPGGSALTGAATPGVSLASPSAANPPASGAASFWLNLVYAFVGGLILNIMPCVLPVIALKILGFVGQSREHPGRVRFLGLLYAVGVLASFLALALVVIAIKAAGKQAGWGMQLANPQVLVVLTVLVTLVALNLFGVFEVVLGSGVMGTVGELTAKEGASGAFFNGVLATVLATPCTAPILSTAVGYAFAQDQPWWVVVAMLQTMGLGLAAPYVLLSWQPGWLKFLPKPGAWMQNFKIAMGFPMLATALWLFTLTIRFYGKRVLWLGLFLVMVAMALWIFGEFFQRGRKRRGLALGFALVLAVGGYLYAIESQLRWRSPAQAELAGSLQESPEGIAWLPWSREALAKARAEGRPVLVDFTADWCLTCQANKKVSLEIPSVRARLKTAGAVALLGDYTTMPPAITEELKRYGRAGVPLVLVYPKDPAREPSVLPEILTPGIVLEALDRAVKP